VPSTEVIGRQIRRGEAVITEARLTVSQWLVAKQGRISVCASVENGCVEKGRINGLVEDQSIFLSRDPFIALADLHHALGELLEAIATARNLTGGMHHAATAGDTPEEK